QRRPKRGDRSAVLRQQRRHRHHHDRAHGDHDQPAEKPSCFTASQETTPRGGVTELSLEECNPETEAADDQSRRSRVMIEKHQRDQDRRGRQRQSKEKAIYTNGRALIGRGQACGRHWSSETQSTIRGRGPSSDRPISYAKIQSAGCHCWSTPPWIRHKAWPPCGRGVHGTQTNRSTPNGQYCNSSRRDQQVRYWQRQQARPSV